MKAYFAAVRHAAGRPRALKAWPEALCNRLFSRAALVRRIAFPKIIATPRPNNENMSACPASLPRPAVSTRTLIGALGIVQIVGWGGMMHMYSAFIHPMQEEFGWSSSEITAALTLGLFVGDLVSIPVGHWVDRRGAHGIMTLGATFGAVLMAAWALVDALWQLYAIWFGMGIAMGLALGNNCPAVITANVKDYRSGLNYIAFLSGLAASVAIPFFSMLIARYGWREALVWNAGIQFVLNACICAWVLRGTVGSRHAAKEATVDPKEGSPLKSALRRSAFWTLAIAFSIHWFVSSCLNFHMLPMLHERGLDLDQALTVVGLTGPAAVSARILLFYSNLNQSARNTGRVVFPLLVLGILVFIASASVGYWGLIVYAIVWGMSNGIIIIVRQTAIAEIFGIRGFGAISGALTTVSILPRTMSPLAISSLHDWLGGYEPVLWILMGMLVVATAAFYVAAADRSPKV